MCRDCKTASGSWSPPNKATGSCSVDGCAKAVYAKGECILHYRKARGFGGSIVSRRKRAEILKRDGYMCQLCHRALDMNAGAQDDMHPSLDHIVPRSQGGTNAVSNLQAAHRVCNARRGAIPLADFLGA